MRIETDPDAAWVGALSGASVVASRSAIEEARQQRRLFSHLAREHASEGRQSYVEIDAPLELHALVRLLRPLHVLEVGVSSGVSSAYLLNALEKNHRGTLHSIDLPSRPRRRTTAGSPPRFSWSIPPGRSSGWAVPIPLRGRWDLRLGDKAEILPLLASELPEVDLFVYDVPHNDDETSAELGLLDPLIPSRGVAIVDHGPGGGMCSALRDWAGQWRGLPVRRAGLGLFGARRPDGSRSGDGNPRSPAASHPPSFPRVTFQSGWSNNGLEQPRAARKRRATPLADRLCSTTPRVGDRRWTKLAAAARTRHPPERHP